MVAGRSGVPRKDPVKPGPGAVGGLGLARGAVRAKAGPASIEHLRAAAEAVFQNSVGCANASARTA